MCAPFLIICVSVLALATGDPLGPERMTVHKIAMTWDSAHRTCKTEGGVLASPTDDKVLALMKSLIGNKTTLHFIGLKSSRYPEPFISDKGVSLEKLPSAVLNMIDSIAEWDGDSCLAMNTDSIRAVPCWSQLPFICYDIDMTNRTNTSEDPTNTCHVAPKTADAPTIKSHVNQTCVGAHVPLCGLFKEGYDYELSLDRCYKVQREKMPWRDAEQTCVDEGGHLVVIEDMEHARTIRNMFGYSWESMWTGIRALGPDAGWTSVNGKRVLDLYKQWHAGYKSANSNICGVFWRDIDLVRQACEFPTHFICERPRVTRCAH